MSAAPTDQRLVPNPLRQDGQWVRLSWHQQRNKYTGRLWPTIKTPNRPTPALAAQDIDRIIYKALGPDAETNGTLTPALKAQLNGLSLEEVMAQVKSTGGKAFSRGRSAYRGVSCDKTEGHWRATFNPGGGRRLQKYSDTELEAAQQYDSWCQQYGRPLSDYNFPPAADDQAAPATAPAPAAGDAAAAVLPPAPPASPIAAMLAAPPPAAAPAADPRSSAATVVGSANPSAAPAAADGSNNSSRPDWEEWAQGEEGEWWTDSSDGEDDWVEGGEAAAADILQTAWQQLHSNTPMPPETQALLCGSGRRGTSAVQPGMQQQQQKGSLLAAGAGTAVGAQVAGGSNHADRDSLTRNPAAGADGGLMAALASAGLPPALAAAAGAASARLADVLQEACAGRGSLALGTGLQSMFVFGGSNGPSSSQPQGEAAAAAAGGASTLAPATQLTIELDSCECLSNDSLLTAAALARAAAAITHHPRTISAADRAVAAAGGAEPPAAAVSEIESALRTAAAQSVRQLQPKGTHYWRGKKAWAHNQHHTASSTASSTASTAEAAAEAAAKAPDTDAAVTAAIAAAAAAGRGCSPQDLHAAWLMQRLDAGLMRVVVQPPLVTTAVLQQALADHGVDVIPGIDYEPVPGLHPELDYPDTLTSTHPAPPTDKGPSSTADCPAAAAAAAAAAAKHSTGESDAIRAGGAGQRDQSAAGCSKSAAEAAGGSSKDTTQPTDTSPTAADTATPDEAALLNSTTSADADPTKQTAAAPAHPTPASAPDTAAAKSPAAAGTPIDWEAALEAAEQDVAALAAYPYPLPGERRPFDGPSSEEEEPYEAQWVAGLMQGKHPAATVSGPRPPYGSSTAGGSGAFAASATAAAADVLGGAGAGGSIDGGRMWDPAQLRREHRQLVRFSTDNIPTIKVQWTGDEMADTVTFLKAVIAEGDADHLPNHVRAYRIGELVKQKDPTFPLDELLAMGRPIEGDYCPVVLGVPPPDPNTPAAAAAAAAGAAAAGLHRPADRARVQDSFDPVNRRPAQVLLLPGCSRSGLKAAERQATAAARAAMLPAEEPTAAVGLAAAAATAAAAGVGPEGLSEDKEARLLAFETVSGTGARQLVQQLRPIKHAAASTPGAFEAAAGGQGSSKGGRRILKATRHSGQTAAHADIPAASPAAAAAAAAASEAAAPVPTGTAVVSAAAAAAADKLCSITSCNEGPAPAAVPPCDPSSSAAALAVAVKTGYSSSGSKAPAAAAAAACKLSSRSGRCGSNGRTAAAAASSGGDPRRSSSSSSSSKANKDRIRMLQEMQRKARTTLAAACSAPVVAAGMPGCAAAAVDDHLSDVHASLLAAAAEAATEAASAVLQPQPMDVDWTHVEDLAGGQGLWQPAQQQVDAALQAARQAAKDRAAETAAADTAAAAGGGGGEGSGDMQTGSQTGAGAAGKGPNVGAGNSAAAAAAAASSSDMSTAASSSKGAGSSGSKGRGGTYLQQQVGLLMGFIRADSCPAISAAEEAALGIKMPRPLAIVHDYAPDSAAARGAAAAVAALVPGGGLTFGSSEEYPPAGSAGDNARVSFGAAMREQQGVVAELERKVQALRKQQEYEDGLEAAFQSGGFEAAATFMAAADAERDAADPNAWIDNHPCPTPDLIYVRAGGTGAWPAAAQAVSKYSRDQPAVVAACELGLRTCATMTAALERRLDVRGVEQQWAEAVSDTPVVAVFVEDPTSSPAAAAQWEAATERDLSEAIAAVLPSSLPLRAWQNALLAYRAASRMQLHLLGHDFPADDVFDNYYEVQLARDADSFWGRVASGEIGQGQDALGVLPHPRVRYYDNAAFWEGLKGQEEERNRAVDAELRWNEECRIVQEAREMQQTAMTAPGALLYDIVVGAHVPVEGLDAFMLGETGRLIIKTTPLQRMEMFVQELVRRNDSVHLPFWQKFVGDLREQGDASQLQGDASG